MRAVGRIVRYEHGALLNMATRPKAAGRGWREDEERRTEWKAKLHQAMIHQAQEDVKKKWLAEREVERERNIAKKLLPAQVTWC